MSLLDHFKPWKLVAEMDIYTSWSGGLLFPDRHWEEKHFAAFYEKTPSIRKIKIIGESKRDVEKLIEAKIYKWRDHKGELPDGAIPVDL